MSDLNHGTRWPRVAERDRARWLDANTLLDLGELTAEWLEGDLKSQPGYMAGCGPDDETQPLITVLAQVNRVGFLTDASRPGFAAREGFDGAVWAQRPAVHGFLEESRAVTLAILARQAGFEVMLHATGVRRDRGRRRSVPVTTRDGVTFTGFGALRRRRDIRSQYGDLCHPTAVAAITSAAQIAIVDPNYADGSALWTLLADWAHAQTHYVAEHRPERAQEQTVTALLALLTAQPGITAYRAHDPAGAPAHRTVLYLSPGVATHNMTRWAVHDQDVDMLRHVPESAAGYDPAFPTVQSHDDRLRKLNARTHELAAPPTWDAEDDPWCEPVATSVAPRPLHPGIFVPPHLRPWSTPWPDYAPLDVTPRELQPAGLGASADAGWAEPYLAPSDVPDWADRQAAALVPFELDPCGWPLNPNGRTGRTGRNLGKWGENAATGPVVVAGRGVRRRVLLIQRQDTGRWALPGRLVEPGQAAATALVRGVNDDAGVDVTAKEPTMLARRVVDDHRNTDHAWVASAVALFELDEPAKPTAGRDVTHARWWPLRDVDELAALVQPDGGLYWPHRPLLTAALDRLA